ncbi:hypothetical protein [Mycobacterium sp.]|uniref:hypothetical protein n=1 Tax=Mycobacterium sp. TaxID=1785 RepID=UPI0025E63E9E|nr:hypothetical protein [Mycobacterium sp.]
MVNFPVAPHNEYVAPRNEYVWQPTSRPIPPAAQSFWPTAVESRRTGKWFAAAAALALLVASTTAVLLLTGRVDEVKAIHTPIADNSALQRWWAGAQNDFTDLHNASDEVDQVFQQFRPGLLVAACHHLHDAAAVGLRGDLPSPDAHVTAELQAATEDFHSAAHLCLAKFAGSKINYDGEFFSSIAEANRHMQAAQNLINRRLTDV